MAPRRAKVNKFDYKKLSANDVICPICRSILIKPITLPCSHGFCSSCFETTQSANVVCPLCRVRVGSWLRSASKSKKLINETFWQAIQNLFPIQVRNKLNEAGENRDDKYEVKKSRESKNDSSVKNNDKLPLNIKPNNSQKVKINNIIKTQSKQTHPVKSAPSTSRGPLSKKVGVVNTDSNSKPALINSEKNDKRPNFINNFATKEYTCRILCQDGSSKETQKGTKESQIQIQKKNKRIQELTESETNDRSNSIESECLYFKPIDYRHNPPSEGLAPIKVPTRKPNVTSHIKILAPSGQNQININHLESAFARLCSPASLDGKIVSCKKENFDSQLQEDNSVMPIKRKHDKYENKAKKKIKINHKPIENQSIKSNESIKATLTNVSDTNQSKTKEDSIHLNNVKKVSGIKQSVDSLTSDDIKRSLQVQADFELAKKLQQTYNQSFKYSTRSTVLKRMTGKNQVTMEGLMTPYKVK